MATTIYRDLDQALTRITRHQPRWMARPELADYDDVVDAIRSHAHDPGSSDAAIRALATIGRDEPDALTVLVYALRPALCARIRRSVTDEYRSDALTELALVILEAIGRGDLDRCHRLASRLVNRTHTRIYKAARRRRYHGVRNITTTDPCPPDRLTYLSDRRFPEVDVATIAAERADLDSFTRSVVDGLEAGELAPAQWASYRDHRLRRALVANVPAGSDKDRTRARRFAGTLQPHVDRHLTVHAALRTSG